VGGSALRNSGTEIVPLVGVSKMKRYARTEEEGREEVSAMYRAQVLLYIDSLAPLPGASGEQYSKGGGLLLMAEDHRRTI